MATSKKEPLSTSRDKATRMSPNLRPSSSESSGYGYGARRARSVPSSPDRKFGSSSPAVAASGSQDVNRPSLSSAGRSVSSRTMSTSGSSIHGSRAQPFPGSAKPMLARAKSDKISTTSKRHPALAVPSSNSFKDTSKTASKGSPSSLLRNKLSPRPCSDNCKATASPKPSTQRMASQGAARGGRAQPVSTARSPSVAAKKRFDGAAASSKSKGVSQKASAATVTRMERQEVVPMQFKETESLSTPSVEDLLQEHLPDPVDLKSTDVDVPNQCEPEPSSNQPEQQAKDEEKEDAGGTELHSGGRNANSGIKVADEPGHTEEAIGIVNKAVPLLNTTEVAQGWKKDDPKGNDAIEEAKRKLLEERKSRVKALVGAFETVMSFKE